MPRRSPYEEEYDYDDNYEYKRRIRKLRREKEDISYKKRKCKKKQPVLSTIMADVGK